MTPTRELLASLEGAGLILRLDGERLLVSPADKLTDGLRDSIREQKASLIAELHWREETALDRAVKNGYSPFDESDVFIPATLLTWGDGERESFWTIAVATAALDAADAERKRLRGLPPKGGRGKRRTKGEAVLPYQGGSDT